MDPYSVREVKMKALQCELAELRGEGEVVPTWDSPVRAVKSCANLGVRLHVGNQTILIEWGELRAVIAALESWAKIPKDF